VVLVVDGQETGPEYADADGESLTFSPDGQRIAFVATIDKEQCCVVDGEPGPGQYSISDLTFSPDSRRVAYGASNGRKHYVLVDGEMGPEFNMPIDGRLCFSPDSKHVAYVARHGSFYLDGKEITEIKGGLDHRRAMAFSPDSSKLALGLNMRRGPDGILLFDIAGKKVGEHLQLEGGWESPLAVAWSPDSRSIAWFGTYSAYCNDQLIGTYFGKDSGVTSQLPRPLRVGFDDDGIWFVVVHEAKVHRVTARPAGTATQPKTQPNPPPASPPADRPTDPVTNTQDEPAPATVNDVFRNWTDATGKYQIEAKLVATKDGWVLLETKDGRKISLPISKLSSGDQAVIEESY
jgi:dipeptidyl aminopeptidase/acylaminoacyl peptidase